MSELLPETEIEQAPPLVVLPHTDGERSGQSRPNGESDDEEAGLGSSPT